MEMLPSSSSAEPMSPHHLFRVRRTDLHGDCSLQRREEISCFTETTLQHGEEDQKQQIA